MRHHIATRQDQDLTKNLRWERICSTIPRHRRKAQFIPQFAFIVAFHWLGVHVGAEESTQPQAQPQATSNECDFTLHSVDQEELRRDRDKEEADAINLMLRDMDDCLIEQGVHANTALQDATTEAEQIYNLNRGFMPNTPGSRSNQSQLNAGSRSNNLQNQAQRGSNANTQNPTSNMQNQGQRTASEARNQVGRFTNSVKDTVKSLGDEVAQSTKPQQQSRHQGKTPVDPSKANALLGNQLGKLEHTFDNYARTLYEAYETETDPVLKNALLQELNNYVNTEE